ncbi:enoyl-CoA hydratase-related protein [Rhodospirillaceae bacterium SYSU D60014]|uniref:enoyl-CoA hydratase/isomerase family protein n=1 Tax=Virgifigura deserti TaxID=2268457 RepID=UPI000E666124
MTYETITYELRGAIGLLTLNRPERLNAISQQMIDELNDLLDAVEKDEAVRVLVVAGAGRAFCSGFDLKDGADTPKQGVADWRPVLQRDFDIIMRFWHLSRPTIAAVQGYCLAGGCELAMACDITIAAEGTRFGEPELRFGSGIVALLLPWLSGPKKAKELLLTGNDKVTAEEALEMGMINRVVPAGQELDASLAMARDIAVMDRAAVAMTKQAINRTYDAMGMREALNMALDVDVQIESMETPEGKMFAEISRRDGLKAAIAWRDARFGGGPEKG